MKAIVDFVDQHHVVRRIAFFVLLYMTWESFQWAMRFAETTTKDATETGLIIAAVTGPVALLQKAVIELYNTARG